MIKKFFVAIQLLILLLVVYWACKNIDFIQLKSAVLSISIPVFIVVLLQRITPFIFLSTRLMYLFGLDFKYSLNYSSLCVSINCVLPFRLGELYKITLIKNKMAIPFFVSAYKIFIERLLDVTALFLMMLIFAVNFVDGNKLIALLLFIVATWFVLVLLIVFQKKISSLKILKKIRYIFRIALSDHRLHKYFFHLLLSTILVWAMNVIHVYLVCNYAFNLNLSLTTIFVVCVAIFASSAFGGLPGGIGIMEGAVMIVLLHFNVSKEDALACALMFRFLYTFLPLLLVLLSFALIIKKNSLLHTFKLSRGIRNNSSLF